LPALLLSSTLLLSATRGTAPLVDIDAPLQGPMATPADVAVVIGNEDYRTLPDVPFAGRDARAVEGFLHYTRGIPTDRVVFVADASRDAMLQAVARGASKIGTGGTLWVYYVGHGAVDLSTNDRVLVAADATDTPKSLARQSLSLTDVLTVCSGPGHRTLVILDASFQGIGRDGKEVFARWRFRAPPLAVYMPEGLMVWTAVAPEQDVRTFDSAQHGLFTYLFVGALRGWADGADRRAPDGMVTLEEAHTWVAEAMGSFGVHPTLERGGSADLWDLSRGAMEEAPRAIADTPAIAGGRQVPAIPVAGKIDPDTAKAMARMAEIRARATQDWSRVAQEVAKGGPRARAALDRFLASYGNETVEIDGRTVVVTVEEVETARSLVERLEGSAL
jgi:hypothetical protein